MSENSDSTHSGDEASADTGRIPSGQWWMALVVAGLLSWAGYNYPPKTWLVPDEMADIGPLSPQEDQDKLAAVENANHWKNSFMKLMLAGVLMGTAALVVYGSRTLQNIPKVASTLVAGLVGGALAAGIGVPLRRYLDRGFPIPGVDDKTRPLVCDITTLLVTSLFLLIPIVVLVATQPNKADRGKCWAVLLAGVVASLLTPIIVSIAMPTSSTTVFPPDGLALTAIWIGLIAVFAALLLQFLKQPEPKATTEAETATA